MTVYAPGTQERDPSKQNMALQQQAAKISANATDIVTNTTNIATNTSAIATNTSAIAAIQGTMPGGIASSSTVTGSSTTYTSSQKNELILRTNSGSPMSDLLPGTSAGVLPAKTVITIFNDESSAILSLKAASGATLASIASTGFIYIGPQQSATIYSDGSNYWVIGLFNRCRLRGSTTIYVASSGSSTNDGLTSSTALPDVGTAYSLAQSILDVNYQPLTFSVANGTYPAVLINGPLLGVNANPINGCNVTFLGNATTPTNVIISTSSANNAWLMTNGAVGFVNGFSLSNSNGHCFQADLSSTALIENLNFALTAAGNNFLISVDSSVIFIVGNLTAVAAATNPGAAWIAAAGGSIQTFNLSSTITMTLTGAFNFLTGFAVTQYYSTIIINTPITFTTGTVSGHRFVTGNGSTINTAGGGANFFPGSTAGTNGTFGTYQ